MTMTWLPMSMLSFMGFNYKINYSQYLYQAFCQKVCYAFYLIYVAAAYNEHLK